MIKTRKKEISGSLIVETILILLPLTLACLLLLEVLRKEALNIVMNHLSCSWVRALSLGAEVEKTKWNSLAFLEKALGISLGRKLFNQIAFEFFYLQNQSDLHLLKLGNQKGAVVQLFYRYSQFISFRYHQASKHHQEILSKCLFPY